MSLQVQLCYLWWQCGEMMWNIADFFFNFCWYFERLTANYSLCAKFGLFVWFLSILRRFLHVCHQFCIEIVGYLQFSSSLLWKQINPGSKRVKKSEIHGFLSPDQISYIVNITFFFFQHSPIKRHFFCNLVNSMSDVKETFLFIRSYPASKYTAFYSAILNANHFFKPFFKS